MLYKKQMGRGWKCQGEMHMLDTYYLLGSNDGIASTPSQE